jgi:parallel beta-helix repeat protein
MPPAIVKAQSKTITVPDDYSTIQSAIAHANAGDTVFVKRGNYSFGGTLGVSKSISLIGEDPSNTIIFNSQPYSMWNMDVIWVDANNVTISGFTISSNERVGGILIDLNVSEEPSRCKIIGNNIVNNNAGILRANNYFSTTQPCFDFICNNTISQNRDSGVLIQSSNTTVIGNTITNNGWSGLAIDYCSNVTITGNNFANNSRGGLWLGRGDSIHIYGNNVTDSSNGYGIQFEGCSNTTIQNNNIIHNKIGVNLANYGLYNYSNWNSSGNIVFKNNIVGNFKNAAVENNLSYYDSFIKSFGEMGNRTDTVFWDNGSVGNYWSDYNGNGTYVIDENNVDHYPLTQQVDISSIASIPTTNQPNAVLILPIAVTFVILTVVVTVLLFRKHRKPISQNKPTFKEKSIN